GLTALTAEFTVGEGKLMTHDEPCSMAPDDKHDLISGTCSHLPKQNVYSDGSFFHLKYYLSYLNIYKAIK
ncbi:hypothetical protein, partial [Escherichia coli]|uniref:hypothetical protein n=1 Tax=Escherichia coli TaxID=562 RepID=UPI00197A86E6